MEYQEFKNNISRISVEEWESRLSIGRFTGFDLQKIVTRPFSYVAKCRIIGNESDKNIYVKVYRKLENRTTEELESKVQQDYEKLCYWFDLFKNSEAYHVVKPVLSHPEKFILVTEESCGNDLGFLLDKKAKFIPSRINSNELVNAFYNTGRWLRYKHDLLNSSSSNSSYSIDEFIAYIDIRLNMLVTDKRRHFSEHYRKKILNFVNQNRHKIEPEQLRTEIAHGDFNPGNIIINNNSVTVLDFGRSVEDSYLLDLSKLYSRIFLYTFKPYYKTSTIRKMQQALLDGYGYSKIDSLMIFKFLLIRNTVTHLLNISKFWQYSPLEGLYNFWVMRNELNYLNAFMSSASGM